MIVSPIVFYFTEDGFVGYSQKHCDLLPLAGNLNTVPISFAISKNHHLYNRLTKALFKIANNGRLNRILSKYDKFRCDTKMEEPEEAMSLHFEDFSGLFFVVGIKLCCALLWGILKKVMHKRMALIRNGSNGKK